MLKRFFSREDSRTTAADGKTASDTEMAHLNPSPTTPTAKVPPSKPRITETIEEVSMYARFQNN